MPAKRVEAYWKAMTPIQADETRIAARVAVHPHTTKEAQTKWLSELNRDGEKFLVESKAMSMKEFVEAINGRSGK